MSNEQHLTLDQVDISGAIREAADDAGAISGRRDLLMKGAVAGGGALAASAFLGPFLSPAQAAIREGVRSSANDVRVLKYALLLEQLEREFYLQALDGVTFTNPQLEFYAKVVAQHEKDHVNTISVILGQKAGRPPALDFGNAVTDEKTFLATSIILEDTGVAAYKGQAENLKARNVIKAALAIHSVEARHAAWARYLAGGWQMDSGDKSPAPVAFDQPLTEDETLAAVGSTGFLK